MGSQQWYETEFADVRFGDKRLKSRLLKVADTLSKHPEQSINQAFDTWADTKAAYNLFANPKVSGKEMMRSHVLATSKRIQSEDGPVFAIADTTGFGTAAFPSITGVGSMGKRQGKDLRGLWLHHVFVVNEQAVPLGFLGQTIWARDRNRLNRRGNRANVSIAKKESHKWIRSLRESFSDHKIAPKIVALYDREADIYEVFCEAQRLGGRYIIRCQHNRCINKSARHSKTTGELLFDTLQQVTVLSEVDLEVTYGRQRDKKRLARVQLKAMPFTVAAPRKKRQGHDDYLEPTNVTVISVEEISQAPEGEEAVSWLLLTNCSTETSDDALQCVKWYRLRWQVEILHRTMKTGFRLEAARLSAASRLMAFAALVSVIAWRVMRLTMVSRAHPNAKASLVISSDEKHSLTAKISQIRKKAVTISTAKQAAHAIASLAGFNGRKCDGEPGTETMWRGWMRLQEVVVDMQLTMSQ